MKATSELSSDVIRGGSTRRTKLHGGTRQGAAIVLLSRIERRPVGTFEFQRECFTFDRGSDLVAPLPQAFKNGAVEYLKQGPASPDL
jgi:hypothetical protein